MKDRKDLFDEKPSESHRQNVFAAVESDLKSYRRSWRWLLVPVAAALGGIWFYIRTGQEPAELHVGKTEDSMEELMTEPLAEEFLLAEDAVTEIEILENIEFFESLEELEQWTES